METMIFILAISNVVCGLALLIAVRVIKTLDENLIIEIRQNEKLRVMYERLVRGEDNGK
jgi:hypothetical protein